MGYESLYESFEAADPGGRRVTVRFRKAGMLAAGDNPELYFFQVDEGEAVVGISGAALKGFQQRRFLSREEKIDLAGLWLKRAIEAGQTLAAENLHIRAGELRQLAADLGVAG